MPKKIEVAPLTREQQDLVSRNARLVPWYASKAMRTYAWAMKGLSRREVESMCQEGLCLAAATWVPSRGPFSCWARLWMRRALQNELRHTGAISIPRVAIESGASDEKLFRRVAKFRSAFPLGEVRGGDRDGRETCSLAGPGLSPLEQAELREQICRLKRAMARLPPRYRQAVRLVCLKEMTAEEASRVMGVTSKAVRSLRDRGVERLRNKLANTGALVGSRKRR